MEKERFALAQRAWCTQGRNVAALENMTDAEIETLASLYGADGKAVDNFREKSNQFLRAYYSDRKACGDTEPGGFGHRTQPMPQPPEAT